MRIAVIGAGWVGGSTPASMWNVEQCGLHFHSSDLPMAHPLFCIARR
jgi:hypothetical protein